MLTHLLISPYVNLAIHRLIFGAANHSYSIYQRIFRLYTLYLPQFFEGFAILGRDLGLSGDGLGIPCYRWDWHGAVDY
jgi:hypothetical protein